MSTQYGYDADDRRTMKIVNTTATITVWSGSEEVAQYASNGTLLRIFVPDGTGAMDSRLEALEDSARPAT